MKLIVAGASGFVATECIRQALADPRFTTVVALARRRVEAPADLIAGADISKLQSVVIDDYGDYSEDVRQRLSGADACIWTVAITPSKAKHYEWAEVRRVCRDYTLAGFQAIIDGRVTRDTSPPLRFMYMSGTAAERDQTKTPPVMPEMALLRGEVETAVLALAAKYPAMVEACCAKPGIIYRDDEHLATYRKTLPVSLPAVAREAVAAAMLEQVVNGFEKEPLQNDDLVRLGSVAITTKKA